MCLPVFMEASWKRFIHLVLRAYCIHAIWLNQNMYRSHGMPWAFMSCGLLQINRFVLGINKLRGGQKKEETCHKKLPIFCKSTLYGAHVVQEWFSFI